MKIGNQPWNVKGSLAGWRAFDRKSFFMRQPSDAKILQMHISDPRPQDAYQRKNILTTAQRIGRIEADAKALAATLLDDLSESRGPKAIVIFDGQTDAG